VQPLREQRRPCGQILHAADVDDAPGHHEGLAIEMRQQAEGVHRSHDAGVREARVEPFVDAQLEERVQRAGQLVEQQQQRAALRGQHAARQRGPLALAAAQVEAALAHRRLEPGRQLAQHGVEGADVERLRQPCRLDLEVEGDVLAPLWPPRSRPPAGSAWPRRGGAGRASAAVAAAL
jgi:hypothetical protein